MGDQNPNLIPIYLEASDKNNLMLLMLLNNEINSKMYNYMQPLKDGAKWVVWFYDDFTRYVKVTENMLNKNIPERIKR